MNPKIDENAARLLQELYAYERVTAMTAEERAILRKWVSEGNSVHENASMSVNENGRPSDFLDVYRYEKEQLEVMRKRSRMEGKCNA
jgi:hypothetical protein